MSDEIRLQWGGFETTCTIDPRDDGLAIEFSVEGRDVTITMMIDHDSAWRLADQLARATSLAAVSRVGAATEAPK